MTTSRSSFTGRALAVVFAAGLPAVLGAQQMETPSGQPLSFLEFIAEDDAGIVRFRFLAPEIGTTYAYQDVMQDFQVICDQQVMPVLDANGLKPRQIVLSMSAAAVPFGQPAPDVLQFFELFRPENGTCIWEEF